MEVFMLLALLFSIDIASLPPPLAPLETFRSDLIGQMPVFDSNETNLEILGDDRQALERHNIETIKSFALSLKAQCEAYTKMDKEVRELAKLGKISWREYASRYKNRFEAELGKCGGKRSGFVLLLKEAQKEYARRAARFKEKVAKLERQKAYCLLNPTKCKEDF